MTATSSTTQRVPRSVDVYQSLSPSLFQRNCSWVSSCGFFQSPALYVHPVPFVPGTSFIAYFCLLCAQNGGFPSDQLENLGIWELSYYLRIYLYVIVINLIVLSRCLYI